MTEEEFTDLKVGDEIRHIKTAARWVVVGNYGDHIRVVKAIPINDPCEWEIERKA